MNTFKIKWSELAKSNLRDIHDYIKYKKQSPQVASIVKKAILDDVKSLETHPERYPLEFYINAFTHENYRFKTVKGRFKIIYRIQDFDLRIIRIFHTSLDPAKLLDID
jgi:plasmid stabilization system protein ParE